MYFYNNEHIFTQGLVDIVFIHQKQVGGKSLPLLIMPKMEEPLGPNRIRHKGRGPPNLNVQIRYIRSEFRGNLLELGFLG